MFFLALLKSFLQIERVLLAIVHSELVFEIWIWTKKYIENGANFGNYILGCVRDGTYRSICFPSNLI